MSQREYESIRNEARKLDASPLARNEDATLSVVELNEELFDEWVQEHPSVLLVNFWADWCQPCRRIAPSLDELASEFEGRARVAGVDIDNSGDLANRFGIRSVPTLVVFRDGRVVDQLVGAAPIQSIRALLERHL